VLPLSHDEVVHGKGSLLGKMPGDDWQKFANLRLLYGYMWASPGKKLLFMGGEFGQWREWNHDGSLDWHQWVDFHDQQNSTISFLRRSRSGELVLACMNLTPVPRANYRIGVPLAGTWREVFNSDAPLYGGSGWGNMGGLGTTPVPSHGQYDSISVVLPPLAAVLFKWEG
jgi:1,4-alpha-glucan branching enzyme